MPKPKQVIREFFIDDHGRDSILMHSGEKTIILFIRLGSEGRRKRKLGVVTISTKTLKITRSRDKHLFIKGNAYGFNDYVLRQGKTFDKVWLKDEVSDWKVPVKFILENGSYLNFKQQGFEVQIFVSLDQIEQFRVKKKERRRF